MADLEAHLTQYHHNRRLIALLPASHPDWMVTVAFYCCIHLIDAVLAREGYQPVDHKSRNRAIANSNRLAFIAKLYDPLYQLPRKVRYMAAPLEWVPFDRIGPIVLGRYLYPIEKSAFRLLGRPEIHELIDLPTEI